MIRSCPEEQRQLRGVQGNRPKEPHKCPQPWKSSGQLREVRSPGRVGKDIEPWQNAHSTSKVTCSLHARQLHVIPEAVCPSVTLGIPSWQWCQRLKQCVCRLHASGASGSDVSLPLQAPGGSQSSLGSCMLPCAFCTGSSLCVCQPLS